MAIDTVPAAMRASITRKASLSDLIMEFFEDPGNGIGAREGDDSDYEEIDGSYRDSEEDRAFWATLHQDLQETLSKDSSAERKLRLDTEESVRKLQSDASVCSCSDKIFSKDYCRKCALRYLTERLREKGYNSGFCKSKWSRSPDIPSGEHSYVDVIFESKTSKRKPIRVVIELNFRAEFIMARPSPNYSNLINTLPEIFVGKSEKLKNVVKIVCSGAKKCMKDNNMHMGPWRKHKYMHSKWLSTPERITSGINLVPGDDLAADDFGERKQKASLLTFDMHYPVMEVV